MADDEQFSLCWNNFNTNLSAGFHESLIRGDLVDVTLAAEGQLVKAHRLILSVCSPYFRKMFTQMPANQHAFIFLKDVSHSALKDLIQFMYCGEVNVKQDALPAFISTAEALQIKGLTETGESAPAQQSPAKDSTSHHHLPSSGASATSPRAKPLQRTRIQSYKLDSDDGSSDHEKVVQIQAGPSPAATLVASSSGPTTTLVTHAVSAAPQQVQIMTTVPSVSQATKRTVTQRASITPQTSQVMKRAKMSDPLEASEPAQIQTVQIVKQITQTPAPASAPTTSSEPEYVEMPIETINPKAEPEYADDPSEVEAIDAEHDQDQALTEQEQHEHDQDADDSANYVEDETYGDMSKYDESYFTEGDDAKAGASGFGSESYTEGGAADQAAQAEPAILLADQIPRPLTWYRADLQYTSSRDGERCFVFRGHRYKLVAMQGTWKCTEPDCHAMMFTRAVNEIQVDNRGHNHPRRGHYQKIHEQDYETIVVNEGSPPLLFDNLNPKPEKWYTTPVPLHVTQKYISFRGYSYRVEKIFNKNNTVAWVCPNASCESRLITRGVHQIWFDSLDHSHTSGKKSTVEAPARKPLEQPKGRQPVAENVQPHQEAQNDQEQVAVEAPKPPSDDVRVTRSTKRSVDPPTNKTRRKSSIPQKNSTPNERSGSPQTGRGSSVANSPSSNTLMVWLPNSGENEPPKTPAESIKVD